MSEYSAASSCSQNRSEFIAWPWAVVAVSAMLGACASVPEPSSHVLAYMPGPNDADFVRVRESLLVAPGVGLQGDATGNGPATSIQSADSVGRTGRRNALLANYYVREESPFYKCSYERDAPCLRPPDQAIQTSAAVSASSPWSAAPWPAGLPRACLALSGGGTRSAAFATGVLQAFAEAGALDKIDIVSGVSGGAYALSWFMANKLNAQANERKPITNVDLLSEDSEAVRNLTANAKLIPTPYGVMAVLANTLDKALKTVLGEGGSANNPYWAALHTTFLAGQCADCAVDGTFKVKDLAPLLQRNQLPMPIFGLSARRLPDGRCDPPGQKPRPLEESYFEVTPLRQGLLGAYSDTGLDLGLADTVALSGAAVSVPDKWYCQLVGVMGQSLGSEWTYRAASHVPDGDVALGRLATSQTTLFLADGGHVENLGVYPLVQRMCRTIFVVDAEHDPLLVYEALKKLTAHLDDRHIAWRAPLLNSLGKGPDAIDRSSGYAADRLKDPVFRGSLGPIPYMHAIENKEGQAFALSQLQIDVRYLKLSIDGDAVGKECERDSNLIELDKARYCAEKRAATLASKPWKCSDSPLGNCPFPQYPTTRQDLSGEEVAALRALGRRNGAAMLATVGR